MSPRVPDQTFASRKDVREQAEWWLHDQGLLPFRKDVDERAITSLASTFAVQRDMGYAEAQQRLRDCRASHGELVAELDFALAYVINPESFDPITMEKRLRAALARARQEAEK